MPETNLLDPPKQVHSRPSVNGAPPEQTDPKPSLIGVAARLYWMLVGNAILYLFAVAIMQQGHQRAWITDVGFWATVGSLVLVRYVDVGLLGGATASGEPASRRDWHRYVARLLPVSSVVWIIAHAVARRVSL